MSTDVRIERRDATLELVIDRPARRNALTLAMYDTLVEALNGAATDASVRVVLIRGEGGSFTSGNDLRDFMTAPPTGEDSSVFRFLRALIDFPKPVVAAVDGWAVGIGTTMLLHCDLVYATPEAKLQLPFVNLALVPEAASSYLVTRMVGHQRAAELFLLGEPFDGTTGQALGFVNELVPADALLAHARAKADALATKAPEALRLTKKLLRATTAEPVERFLREEAALFIQRLASPEMVEAATAFFEKRKPDFSRT